MKYTYNKIIVPIGCDCHPAYVLKKLDLRYTSLPFDWLNIEPKVGLSYVTDNIKNDFKYFISDLKINDDGYIVSSHYECAEFYHEKDLIENTNHQLKMKRRVDRFNEIIKNDIAYLHMIPMKTLTNQDVVNEILENIIEFQAILKPSDTLSVYIRSDDKKHQNEAMYESLMNKSRGLNQVTVAKYIRNKDKYGQWGNEDKYNNLLTKVGIKLSKKYR